MRLRVRVLFFAAFGASAMWTLSQLDSEIFLDSFAFSIAILTDFILLLFSSANSYSAEQRILGLNPTEQTPRHFFFFVVNPFPSYA
jgi:hypothetical protein